MDNTGANASASSVFAAPSANVHQWTRLLGICSDGARPLRHNRCAIRSPVKCGTTRRDHARSSPAEARLEQMLRQTAWLSLWPPGRNRPSAPVRADPGCWPFTYQSWFLVSHFSRGFQFSVFGSRRFAQVEAQSHGHLSTPRPACPFVWLVPPPSVQRVGTLRPPWPTDFRLCWRVPSSCFSQTAL